MSVPDAGGVGVVVGITVVVMRGATFAGYSTNGGVIVGDATFTSVSTNEGRVTGVARFVDDSCNATGGTAGTFVPNPPPEC
jgi:hypothetical protein